ncbi:MAG: ATP-binding protein [Burkholderiales bacterium]
MGSLLHRYRNLSLRAKFALPIALFVILLFGALIPGVLYLQTRTVLEGARERGLELTNIFAHSSVQAVVSDDFLVLRQIINSIASSPDVVYAMILDPGGRLVVHSDMREAGRTYTDPPSRRAAETTEPLVQETETDGIRMYDFTVPIYVLNERRAVARVGISLEREWAGIRRIGNMILGLGVLALAMGLGLATWLARNVTRPIRELAEGAQEIAAGNLDRVIAVREMDEVGRLGETFNRMASSLKARSIENAGLYEEVTKHAEELEAKVEARTRELQETNRRLEAASRHKSEFLANMSHELRTPLNAIIGFTRLVMRRSKEVLPAKQYENLEKINLSADQLLLLINDVLDLSKVEAGRMEVRPVSFELETLIDSCLRTVEPMIRPDQIHVAKDLEPGLPPLVTDQDKLTQILMNLLSNAIKFTEGGTITVRARRHADQVALAVIDPGVGIPGEALELIFEEFRQVDSSSTRRHGGTGLGLSISRHFARLLGGDITVQSTLGRGSTFTLTIPMRYERDEPAPQATQAIAALKPVEAAHHGKVMLAIDDDPDTIYLLRENLVEAGYRVVGALSGQEGLEKARTLRPFAITLDLLMAHRNGWEVLRDLKSDPVTMSIPVIVISVVDSKEPAFRLGAFDYLVKPFDRDAIIRALERIPPPGRGRAAAGS